MPNSTFACGSGSDNHSCKMEMPSKNKMKDCCNKNSKETKDKGCSGKCGQSMCSVSSLNIAITSMFQYEGLNPLFNFLDKKQNFSQSVSFLSDGYSSIWLIPKIA